MTNLKLVSGAGSLARAAYLRTKELMSAVMDDYLEVVRSASREYEALPVNERSEYCRLCGWTEQTVKDFRRTLEKYPNKQRLIESTRANISLESLDLGIAHMSRIARLDDEVLKEAAARGDFDKEVTTRKLERLAKTGSVAKPKPKPKVQTELSKMKGKINSARSHIDKARDDVDRVRDMMEKNGVTGIRGPEIKRFWRAFENLCAEVAAVDPEKTQEALKILRGQH